MNQYPSRERTKTSSIICAALQKIGFLGLRVNCITQKYHKAIYQIV